MGDFVSDTRFELDSLILSSKMWLVVIFVNNDTISVGKVCNREY